MLKRFPEAFKLRVAINVIAGVIGLLLTLPGEKNLIWFGFFDRLETISYDLRIASSSEIEKTREDIVIVDIDNAALRSHGQWPWSYDQLNKFYSVLYEHYRPRAIGMALPLTAQDNDFDSLFVKIKQDFPDDFQLHAKLERYKHTENFLTSISQQIELADNVMVLSYAFNSSARTFGTLPKPSSFADLQGNSISQSVMRPLVSRWPFYRGYISNTKELVQASDGSGHLFYNVDADGLVRSLPLFVNFAGGTYSHFVLAMLENQNGIFQTPTALGIASNGLEQIAVGQHEVGVNADGQINLRYIGSENQEGGSSADAFLSYSAVNILNKKVNPQQLRDKLILIGSSALQKVATPTNAEMPVAQLYATAIANIIDGVALHRASSAATVETIFLVGLGIILSLSLPFLSSIVSLIVILAIGAGSLFYGFYVWDVNNEIIRIIPIPVLLSLLFLFNLISGLFVVQRASYNLQSTFGQYVPPEIANQLRQKSLDTSFSLDGASKEMSVLFSDIRDFTRISEQLSPQTLIAVMNYMLTELTEAIYAKNGTVDKYIGDAVMAFWNAPLDDKNHALHSVLAALEMQRSIVKVGEHWKDVIREELRMGIGVHTGECRVGNMGSKQRMAYTAMGDAVNLASRLENLTKHYGCPIIVSQSVMNLTKDKIGYRYIDNVRVKGRVESIKMYEPLGMIEMMSPEQLHEQELHEAFVKVYSSGDFAAAAVALEKWSDKCLAPNLSMVFANRLEKFKVSPPENWDGTWLFEEK